MSLPLLGIWEKLRITWRSPLRLSAFENFSPIPTEMNSCCPRFNGSSSDRGGALSCALILCIVSYQLVTCLCGRLGLLGELTSERRGLPVSKEARISSPKAALPHRAPSFKRFTSSFTARSRAKQANCATNAPREMVLGHALCAAGLCFQRNLGVFS